MKKGDVVVYREAFFLVTKTDKDYAHINKINKDGLVLALSQKMDRNKNLKIIKGCKKRIKIEIPFADVNDLKYQTMVRQAKGAVYKILTCKDKTTLETQKKYLAVLAMQSCKISHNGVHYDLHTFAQNIKLKVATKLYDFIADRILMDIKERSASLDCLSDKALNYIISNYMTYWNCWHGFSKKLDKALAKDFRMHMDEYRARLNAVNQELKS